MWRNVELVRLLALAFVVRACYEAARPPGVPSLEAPVPPEGGCGRNLTASKRGASVEGEPSPDLPPQVEEWKRKELRRYREAQERKWRRWMEAVYQPKS